MQLPKFNNQNLFDQAFTHRSFLNETKEQVDSNERLEFLGDSIISFVVSEYLYNKYPDFDEGVLTNLRSLLVNTKSLANIAEKLDFGNYLKLSKGEEESRGRQNQSLLADSFEAFLGALFIDQGIENTKAFILEIFIPMTDELIKESSFKDPKSLLQEYVQSKKQNSPVYKVVSEAGPAHNRTFTMGVYVNNEQIATGEGKSKQEAEESAAKLALDFFHKSKSA
jgi:ribonuclease-3